MSTEFVTYHSDKPHAIGVGLLTVVLSLGGYVLSSWILSEQLTNTGIIVGFYLSVSFGVFFMGLAIGKLAKNRVEYDHPSWEFAPVQLTREEVRSLSRSHLRKYSRLLVYGHYMVFYAPVILILLILGLPTYASIENPATAALVLPIVTILVPVLFLLSTLLGFLATTNAASEDFNLPLLREVIWIAEQQSNVPGVSYLRVVLDMAEREEYRIYRNPRVVVRMAGIERAAYIESWSEEKGALSQLMCRLYPEDSKEDIIWWWLSEDRYFRKFVGNDDEGYHVKYPVPSKAKELGVKDVRLVTMNAVAIILSEWQRIHGNNEELTKLLVSLGVSD